MSLDDQNLECPLCMEPFEMDDFNFFPCTCGYQICRFCWHRIRTDENGLCPACRKQYPEDPADFKPLSAEELQKIKSEKRQKDQQRKQKMSECRKHLANVRVVQKNLVFVVGLPARLADAEGLKKHDYFGKFGKIHKVVVNQSTSYAGSQGPSASAYVTYCRQDDALRAIKSVNNIQVDGRTLKASLGTTKYCSHFLKNQQCPKADCMYLHELGDEAASFTKEDMQQGKHQEYEKKLQDQIIGCNRKQSASPTPQQNSSDTNQETWPCTVQSIKELGPCRSKDSTQGQRTDKSSRSKNKHCFSEGQKSKKSKNRNSESSHSSVNVSKISDVKDDGFVPRKSQKQQKHSKDMSSQPSGQIPLQRVDGLSSVLNVPGIISTNKSPEVTELNNNNPQTTFVQISEKPLSNHSSENIKITRSESPSLPPSPTSSSSSSLFTPFGSLSSNFLSSSSPSPPPSNASQSFGILGSSSRMQGADSPTNTYAAPAVAEPIKRQSSSQLFGNSKNSDSLFSHMINLPISSNCGSYNGHVPATDEMPPTDSLDWNSSYPFDSQKQLEDDLDFDPWDESSKGLADLMATEASHNVSYTTTSMPPGFSQPMNAPMPNSQRISIPPPGFGSKQQVQHTGALNNIPNSYGINSEFNSKLFVNEKRQTLIQKLPHLQSPPQNHSNHSKQPQHHYSREFSSRVNDILRIKNFQEGFRALFPNINVSFGSHNNPKNHAQNGQAGNYPASRDLSWLYNDSTVLNSGNITEAQRSNAPYLMKALQQLKIEDTLGPFNGHSSYSAPFALQGQWPSSTQCPPPGFVAPSRSPANNTPFQHMQVNQKI